MVSLVNSNTNARHHLWEIDLRFAPGLPPGWKTHLSRFGGRAWAKWTTMAGPRCTALCEAPNRRGKARLVQPRRRRSASRSSAKAPSTSLLASKPAGMISRNLDLCPAGHSCVRRVIPHLICVIRACRSTRESSRTLAQLGSPSLCGSEPSSRLNGWQLEKKG